MVMGVRWQADNRGSPRVESSLEAAIQEERLSGSFRVIEVITCLVQGSTMPRIMTVDFILH